MDMHPLYAALWLFLLEFLFAGFEIEAEGPYGWAERFPTFYRRSSVAARVWIRFTGKPLTGYHAFLFATPLVWLLYPMVSSGRWSWSEVLKDLAIYLMFASAWDFAWFVLNPAYRLRDFPYRVWWFAQEPSFLHLPLSYYVAWTMSTVVAALSGLVTGLEHGTVTGHAVVAAVEANLARQGWTIACMLFLIMFVRPWYQQWYASAHDWKKDERYNLDPSRVRIPETADGIARYRELMKPQIFRGHQPFPTGMPPEGIYHHEP